MLTGLRLSGGTSPRRAGTAIVSATAVRWGRDDRWVFSHRSEPSPSRWDRFSTLPCWMVAGR